MREAIGDAMGALAGAAAAAAPCLAAGDPAVNPLLRVAVEALADQKREVQAAAAHAFAQARALHSRAGAGGAGAVPRPVFPGTCSGVPRAATPP